MSQADDLATQAYAAWELIELEQAADLFEAAAEAEAHAASNRGPFALPDQSFLHRLRGALCRWDSGDFERARKVLLAALSFDYKGARLWGDRMDAEKAFTRLLMEKAVTGDRVGFIALWKAATVRGDELSMPFPTAVPHQKRLLCACASLSFTEGWKQIAERIDPKHLAADHELQMLIAQTSMHREGWHRRVLRWLAEFLRKTTSVSRTAD